MAKTNLPLSWNSLNPAVRYDIAREAGFSASDCALLSKIRWEGFPQFIINMLYDKVDWHAIQEKHTAQASKAGKTEDMGGQAQSTRDLPSL